MEIPSYVSNKELVYKNFPKFPYASYSNGTPCFIVNLYFYSSPVIKLSQLSIKRLAYCLAMLIRYCEHNSIDIVKFGFNDFIGFSNSLKLDLMKNKKTRNNTTINNILKNVLFFYKFVGETIYDSNNYVEKILKANIKDLTFNNNLQDKKSFSHPAFLPNSPVKTRNPISKNQIELIYETISDLYVNSFSQERLKVLVLLLEVTGARIGELADLKVNNIVEAFKMDKPLLIIKTLKRKQEEYRNVPVAKNDLKRIIDFINTHRKIRIRKTVGVNEDDGFLFISYKTGKHVTTTSLINEFGNLRAKANISEPMSAHMFRHRFITNMFVQLLKNYDIENKDNFRKALLDVSSLKVYIQEVTGHKSSASLDTYLHLAKEELTNMGDVLKKIDLQRDSDSMKKEYQKLLRQLENKEISVEYYLEKAREINIY